MEPKLQKQIDRGMRSMTRYSVRVQADGGTVREVGLGTNVQTEIAYAIRYAERFSCSVWVVNTSTRKTIYRVEGTPLIAMTAGGGGAQ